MHSRPRPALGYVSLLRFETPGRNEQACCMGKVNQQSAKQSAGSEVHLTRCLYRLI